MIKISHGVLIWETPESLLMCEPIIFVLVQIPERLHLRVH